MKDTSKTECETQTAIHMESTKLRSERLKGIKMRTQEMRSGNGKSGFLIASPHGFVTSASCAIGVAVNSGDEKESSIVQIANGISLKIRFIELLKRLLIAFKNFIARSQMNDNTVEIIRSDI